MNTSVKCPFCGGNPVIYDSEFSEYVCPHCGAVLDDHPVVDFTDEPRASDEYKHIGSYILNLKFRKMALRNTNVVHTTEYRRTRLAVSFLRDLCSVVGVPGTVCSSAEKKLVSIVDMLRDKLASRPKVLRLLRLLAALSLYVTARELGYAVALEDIAAAIGVSAGKLYTELWQYRGVVGYKYTDTAELYLVRVMKAMSRQLAPEQLEKVAKLTRELMEKYPVAAGKPVNRALAYALVACRMLGVRVCVNRLASELGVSDYVYSRARRLYSLIKRLEKREKK